MDNIAVLPTDAVIEHVEVKAQGALDGADRMSRETANWNPSLGSPDRVVNNLKPTADARGRDTVRNNGMVQGAVNFNKDSIVGTKFRLNARPNWRFLGLSEDWADEFQVEIETIFQLICDSQSNWLHAKRTMDFSEMVRLSVASYVISGETIVISDWDRSDPSRPINTCSRFVSPDLLCNPNGLADTELLRRGVLHNSFGRPISYNFKKTYHFDVFSNENSFKWVSIPANKPWGRPQVLHITEPMFCDQTRGVSEMVSVLKEMRMTKRFSEISLQNAVVNASYAAAIESELPSMEVYASLGAGSDPMSGLDQYLQTYLGALGSYMESSKNVSIDGSKIPHLFPGTKLNMLPMGTPGGVGSEFEKALHRQLAAGFNMSYEEFSRDFSQSNYSSARAAMNGTYRSMMAKKKIAADKFASFVYVNVFEELWNKGLISIPKGKTRDWFYEPFVKDALTQATWIGAGRGQIDEMKETQSAIMRINSGLSTYEAECARLGEDFRDVFSQRSREEKMIAKLGLQFTKDSSKQNAGDKSIQKDNGANNE